MYFEEPIYSIKEGSNLTRPIRLHSTTNQNPFNLTLRTVTIDSTIIDTGLEESDNSAIMSNTNGTAGIIYN